jgi:transcriptional regulator with XRE-family HTH domain
MSEMPMSERLKILIPGLGLKVGTFARAMGVSDTNVRNYLDRGSKPSSEFLEKLVQTFDTINPAWLLTGKGEPFLHESGNSSEPRGIYQKNISGGGVGVNQGTNTTNNYSMADCEKERDSYKAERDKAFAENELLRQLLTAKDETIALLRDRK